MGVGLCFISVRLTCKCVKIQSVTCIELTAVGFDTPIPNYLIINQGSYVFGPWKDYDK